MKSSRKITILIPPLLIGLTVLQFIFVYQHERNVAAELHEAEKRNDNVETIVTEPLPPITVPIDEFVERASLYCSPESRGAEFCVELYSPVCAQTQVECITEPCDPIPKTYSNSCFACAEERVLSYTEGACVTDSEIGY